MDAANATNYIFNLIAIETSRRRRQRAEPHVRGGVSIVDFYRPLIGTNAVNRGRVCLCVCVRRWDPSRPAQGGGCVAAITQIVANGKLRIAGAVRRRRRRQIEGFNDCC